MSQELPPQFAQLKKEIASSYPDFEQRVSRAWNEVVQELDKATKEVAKEGSSGIPQVNFADIDKLSKEELEVIKRKGSVVIKDVVDDQQATEWKKALDQLVKDHPEVPGFPDEDKQFFHLYHTGPQVQARSHPNVLKASAWLNSLYHAKEGLNKDGVDLSTPLSYEDRFRMRHPGGNWDRHPPHIDGGNVERWQDPYFRACYADILSGNWRQHDPYNLDNRVKAKTSLYGRPNQATVFRTFQAWTALTTIAPHNGTLKVFPDLLLSNAYIILRPFFNPLVPEMSEEIYDPKNWKFDISTSVFPAIAPLGNGYLGPKPTEASHPHLRLKQSMTSVPKVAPGDIVAWHGDVIHAVESEHLGSEDSAVMYIPAVPTTPQNLEYIKRQNANFLKGMPSPDFPQDVKSELEYSGCARKEDILSDAGLYAMGFNVPAPVAVN